MFTRLLPHLILLFLLLFTQTGGLLHGFSHWTQKTEQGQNADYKCGLCDEYAQLQSPLAALPALFLSPLPTISAPNVAPLRWVATACAAFAARAPPDFA